MKKLPRSRIFYFFVFAFLACTIVVGAIAAILIIKDRDNKDEKNNTPNDNNNQSQTGVVYKPKFLGECTNIGADEQTDNLTQNPCRLVNETTGETIVTAKTAYGNNENCENAICIGIYSSAHLGKRTDNIQQIIVSGGEGGEGWFSVYSVNLADKSVNSLDDQSMDFLSKSIIIGEDLKRLTTKECIDPTLESYYETDCIIGFDDKSQDEKDMILESLSGENIENYLSYELADKKYSISYYNALLAYRESPDCELSKDENCVIALTIRDTETCKDLTNEKAYLPECFSNWDKLNSKMQKDVKEQLSNLWTGVQKVGYPIVLSY